MADVGVLGVGFDEGDAAAGGDALPAPPPIARGVGVGEDDTVVKTREGDELHEVDSVAVE